MKFARYTLAIVTLTASTTAFAHGARGYFKSADADNDGKITQEEARRAADARFAKLDTNNDGVITQAEVDAVKQAHRAKFAAKADERFAKKDKNNDGKLSRDEVPRMPEEIFKKMDTNNDGALSKEELHARGPHRGPKGDKAGHANHGSGKHGGMLEKLDANGDGNVTKAEAEAAALEHFKRMDKNSDGVITQDEVRKGPRGKHGAKRHKGAENSGARAK